MHRRASARARTQASSVRQARVTVHPRWAAGIDRLALMLEEDEVRAPGPALRASPSPPAATRPIALAAIVSDGPEPVHTVLRLQQALLRRGVAVTSPFESDGTEPLRLIDISKQLSRAGQAQASHTIIVAPDELSRGEVQIKAMATGKAVRLPLAAVLAGTADVDAALQT